MASSGAASRAQMETTAMLVDAVSALPSADKIYSYQDRDVFVEQFFG